MWKYVITNFEFILLHVLFITPLIVPIDLFYLQMFIHGNLFSWSYFMIKMTEN